MGTANELLIDGGAVQVAFVVGFGGGLQVLVLAVHHGLVVEDEVLGELIEVLLGRELDVEREDLLLGLGVVLVGVASGEVVGSVLLGVITHHRLCLGWLAPIDY